MLCILNTIMLNSWYITKNLKSSRVYMPIEYLFEIDWWARINSVTSRIICLTENQKTLPVLLDKMRKEKVQ